MTRTGRLRVAMALYGDVTFDSRVRREASSLAEAGHEVTIVCLTGTGEGSDLAGVRVVSRRPRRSAILPGVESPFVAGSHGRLSGLARKIGWLAGYVGNLRAWGRMAVDAVEADVWHVHDLTGLVAVAPYVRRRAPVVYDAHELFLETGTARRLPALARRLLRAYEARLVRQAFAVLTVNDALAAVLRERYRPRRIEVLHNCPDRWTPPTDPDRRLRAAMGLDETTPVVLYHGALSPHRGIEQLVAALGEPGLEHAHLALLGFGESRADYERLAARSDGRVRVLAPVPPSELLAWVSSADVGAMPIQASTLNHYLSTPNKLFECIAAGVPVVTSDFPAMSAVVGRGSSAVGTTCDPADPLDIARALRWILDLGPDERVALRQRCLAAAREHWNWQHESDALLRVYRDAAAVVAATR